MTLGPLVVLGCWHYSCCHELMAGVVCPAAASEMAGLRRLLEGMRQEMQGLEDELFALREERSVVEMERAAAADEADAAAAALAAAEARQADLVAAVDEARGAPAWGLYLPCSLVRYKVACSPA